jgi:hypothetical protein
LLRPISFWSFFVHRISCIVFPVTLSSARTASFAVPAGTTGSVIYIA